MPRPVRKRHVSSSSRSIIRDVWGNSWRVGEVQPTPYGFFIYRGWPHLPGSGNRGRAAVIATGPLARHLRATVQRPHHLPLPMGRKTLRRVRQALGLDHRIWIDTRLDWWISRIDDLAALSAVKFAAKHSDKSWSRQGTVSSTLVCRMRQLLLGDCARPMGWWRDPKVLAVIKSYDLTLDQIAERLGISPITVSRIRRRLREKKGLSDRRYITYNRTSTRQYNRR